MRESSRLIATAIIWIAFTMMMGLIAAAVATASDPLDVAGGWIVFAIIMVLTVAVTISTRAIWNAAEREPQAEHDKKLKRESPRRMERLLEALDEDEIYDLESLLLAREEEVRQQKRQ